MTIRSDTPLVHGMGTMPAERDWREISPREAEALLDGYPELGGFRELVWHSPRPFSSAAIAETSSGPVFLKRYHASVRDEEGLLEEHRLLRHLRDRGAAVGELLADRHGRTAQAIGDWTYEVQPLAAGEDIYRDAISWTPFLHCAHAREAGIALARLHLAAEGFDAPARPPRPLVSSFGLFASPDPLSRLTSYVAERPALSRYLDGRDHWRRDLSATLLPLHADLLPLLGELEPLWTHNDLHASNLLWTCADEQAQVVTVLDFGLADRTTAVYDLATTLERNTIQWLLLDDPAYAADTPLVRFDQLDALLDGYESIRPLSPAEARALPLILPLVHAEYALSEIHYFEGIVGSRANADLAYDAFLFGHARWFGTEEGRAVSERLRRRAERERNDA